MSFEEKRQESIPYHTQERQSTALKAVRAAQYVWCIITIAFVACAIDRNILIPGVTADEKALAASVSLFMTLDDHVLTGGSQSGLAALVVLFHLLTVPRKPVTLTIDGLTTLFLFGTFVYGVYNTGNMHGACKGPKKIGVWDNTRGCTRMTVAAAFSGVNFATFAISTVLALFAL